VAVGEHFLAFGAYEKRHEGLRCRLMGARLQHSCAGYVEQVAGVVSAAVAGYLEYVRQVGGWTPPGGLQGPGGC